jgi:isopenicillin-N N-acyltransferase like protein
MLAEVNERPRTGFATRHRKKLVALAILVVGPLAAHGAVGVASRIEPPAIAPASGEPGPSPIDPDLRVLGPAYARHRGKILEVRLAGTPEQMGHQHGRLLYPEMVENEGSLYGELARVVPFPPARGVLLDVALLRFRHIDRGMPDERRREMAAEAQAFAPDPYEGFLPTYHRFAFLHALYDIALSFERSPLIGCTSFALTDGAAADGHVVLARNFDFEAGPLFDEKKAVFLVREDGRIPYASVSWPGLVGTVTGMNAEGLALVVHGGRARHPRAEGEPVLQTLRDLLGRARSTSEALALLGTRAPMVSHLVMLADAGGDVAIAERAPGEPLFVRRGRGKVPLTNHFEGPLADDPANRRVEAVTSTRARRLRLDELLEALPAGASAEQIVGVLRDRKGLGGSDLALGNRRALDALIATHSVVMDVTARGMWVSEGPHLAGRYVYFDVGRLLGPGFEPGAGEPVTAIAADAILTGGAYDAWVRAGSPHRGEP